MPTCSGSLRRSPQGAPLRYPPLSRANHVPSRLLLRSDMVTRVGEHCLGFQNGFVDAARRPAAAAVSAAAARRACTAAVRIPPAPVIRLQGRRHDPISTSSSWLTRAVQGSDAAQQFIGRVAVEARKRRRGSMVELKDTKDGRVALIMDKEELPFAVEALMRAGYGLTSPSEAEAEEPEVGAEEPDEPEAEADESEEREAEAEELDEEKDDDDDDEEEEEEEEDGRSPVRRRGSRARRLWADTTTRSRARRS